MMGRAGSGPLLEIREILEARAAMEKAVRDYFDSEGFLEVTTPVMVPHPNLDPNIRPIPVRVADVTGRARLQWLHTSPELSMKKLLAKGSGSIYQLAPVFRDEEHTGLHRCEFTMLEWYREEADYEDAIRDTIRVVRAACGAATGGREVVFGGLTYDLEDSWQELTMAEAFARHAGVGSFARDELAEALESLGYRVSPEAPREELFFHLYLESVEPHLGMGRPTIVRDYPSFLGTMARPREDDAGTLERFEVYIGGVELANGYTELEDAVELGRRMEEVLDALSAEGVKGLSIDEGFLEAMADLPPCAGVSVGMDRLAMIALDAQDIG